MVEPEGVQKRLDDGVNEILRRLATNSVPAVNVLLRETAEKYDVTVEQLERAWSNTDFIGR
jgi:hypothetical protein